MRKFNLPEYIEFCEFIFTSLRTLSMESNKKGYLWYPLLRLKQTTVSIYEKTDIFPISQNAARDVINSISEFFKSSGIWDEAGELNFETFDDEIKSWDYYSVKTSIERFLLILRAESNDSLVFIAEPSGVYDFKRLYSKASNRFHDSYREFIPQAAMSEYDEAGRCFIFGVYTSCGFHSLRAMELMIKAYIESFGKEVGNLKTWSQYVKAIEDLEKEHATKKDLEKVPARISAIIDRVRAIDRNPLMHPEEVLSLESSDNLFSLSWVTISELAKDISDRRRETQVLLVSAP